MRRIARLFVILFSAAVLATSCLSDDNATDITYYSDTAITSFSLGTLNRTMWTKSSTGEDSSYVTEVDGSVYKFYIDQLKREIYNPDSLPVRTDAAHVLCNVSSKNSGFIILAYKDSEDNDSLVYFNSSDSLDFTEPIEFRIYANDGIAYRAYKVSVNVHKEDPDSINWYNAGSNPAFTSMAAMKSVAFKDRLFVFGTDRSNTSVYSASLDAPGTWTELSTDNGATFDANAYASVVAKGDSLYTISGGRMMRSYDGNNWTSYDIQGNTAPIKLIAAGRSRLYGIDALGQIVSSEYSNHAWTVDAISGDVSMLPDENIGYGSLALTTDDASERIIIAGNRSLSSNPEDSVAMVWSKIEEYSTNSERHSWMFCNEDNGYNLPRLANLKMLAYGDVLIALGGQGEGTSTAEAFSAFYVSEDNGLTWHDDDKYYMPEGFDNAESDVFTMTVDENNYLWIVCGGTGTVWRGRVNRLGWEEDQTSFTE